MSKPRFTVLLPIHRPPNLLPFAIESVRQQVKGDFELFIICDGAPPETARVGRRFADIDQRIQVFDFPKGEGNGESHRHEALRHAMGRYVAQLGDDDLWFPDHLQKIEEILEIVEFGNLLQSEVNSDGSIHVHFDDLSNESTQRRMIHEKYNFFGPTVAGYRLSTYRRLPIGWAPGPADVWSDLHMWRKFLSLPDIRVGTSLCVTSIKFAAYGRSHMSIEEREDEIKNAFYNYQFIKNQKEFCDRSYRFLIENYFKKD
jgi:succinoglycan biosynthesis protein ExoW